jgi:hypothetical protein
LYVLAEPAAEGKRPSYLLTLDDKFCVEVGPSALIGIREEKSVLFPAMFPRELTDRRPLGPPPGLGQASNVSGGSPPKVAGTDPLKPQGAPAKPTFAQVALANSESSFRAPMNRAPRPTLSPSQQPVVKHARVAAVKNPDGSQSIGRLEKIDDVHDTVPVLCKFKVGVTTNVKIAEKVLISQEVGALAIPVMNAMFDRYERVREVVGRFPELIEFPTTGRCVFSYRSANFMNHEGLTAEALGDRQVILVVGDSTMCHSTLAPPEYLVRGMVTKDNCLSAVQLWKHGFFGLGCSVGS